MHKERATKFSATIAAAVKSEWKEATSGTVTLPEDDPELFEIFAGFIYTGGVHCTKQDDPQNTQDTERARLADLWVFGDKLQAPEFKDAVVDATDESVRSGGAYPRKMHEIVYAKSVTTSAMRRLLVDMCIWAWAKGSLKDAERGPAWEEFFLRCRCEAAWALRGQTLKRAFRERRLVPLSRSRKREAMLQDRVFVADRFQRELRVRASFSSWARCDTRNGPMAGRWSRSDAEAGVAHGHGVQN